jgi:U4/U6 small nuclear ribonucleoprotein PRP3
MDPIPDVEWWDALILFEKDYTSTLLTDKITHLVEHPVLIKPPAEAPPPPPQPLKLTKKVKKNDILKVQERYHIII